MKYETLRNKSKRRLCVLFLLSFDPYIMQTGNDSLKECYLASDSV